MRYNTKIALQIFYLIATIFCRIIDFLVFYLLRLITSPEISVKFKIFSINSYVRVLFRILYIEFLSQNLYSFLQGGRYVSIIQRNVFFIFYKFRIFRQMFSNEFLIIDGIINFYVSIKYSLSNLRFDNLYRFFNSFGFKSILYQLYSFRIDLSEYSSSIYIFIGIQNSCF